jgi:hypothetical protein
MYRYTLHLLFLICFFAQNSSAQNLPLQLNSRAKEVMDRLEILGIDSITHAGIGLPDRDAVAETALRYAVLPERSGAADQADAQYLLDETALCSPAASATSFGHTLRERPLLKHFFKTQSQFFSITTPDFRLVANPLLDLRLGRETNGTSPVFRNERGIQIYGDIGRKLQFFTQLQEIQTRLPQFYDRWSAYNKGYPGFALTKQYQGSINKKFVGFDTNISEAYITGNLMKQIRFQFGHGRNFIGNGYRSLLLSDFSPVSLFLRLDARVWRFHYTNLFAELSATQPALLGVAEKKYTASHFINLKVLPNWSVGIFETTVFSRPNGFEAQYLNPVIFYRSVEGMIGSPDNILLGMSTKLNIRRSVQVYGQLILDEFYSRAIFNAEEKGWWANKVGTQIGVKYLNALGVNHLDLQFETNTVRPYTYSHKDQLTSYTHYGQPLAHALGSNFREYIGIARYQAGGRLFLEAKGFFWKRGHSTDGKNYGSDPWESYENRLTEYGNFIGQGDKSNVAHLSLLASYMVGHNLFLDANLVQRKETTDLSQYNQTLRYGTVGIRWNTWRRREEL